jgi:hypothetical protein
MIRFIRLSLATWRLASLLVNEAGLFSVFARLRQAVGVRTDSTGRKYAENELGELFTCIWCMSIWTAGIVLICERVAPRLVDVLAISAAAIGWQRRGIDE